MNLYLVVERMMFEHIDALLKDNKHVGFLGSYAYPGGSHKYLRQKIKADANLSKGLGGAEELDPSTK